MGCGDGGGAGPEGPVDGDAARNGDGDGLSLLGTNAREGPMRGGAKDAHEGAISPQPA